MHEVSRPHHSRPSRRHVLQGLAGLGFSAAGLSLLAGCSRLEVSPVGNDGEFYFEDLPGVRLPATIEDEHGTCDFILLIPAADTLAVDLGAMRCTVEGAP